MHMGRCSICGRGEMAGVMKGKAWGLGILMMVVVLGVWEVRMASAAVSAAKCKEERRLGINACKAVVYGKSPTPACCHRMRVTHLGCVCSVITPKLAALVDVNRMIELVKGCGRKLPRHYKCGSMLSLFLFLLLSQIHTHSTVREKHRDGYKYVYINTISFYHLQVSPFHKNESISERGDWVAVWTTVCYGVY